LPLEVLSATLWQPLGSQKGQPKKYLTFKKLKKLKFL